MIGYFWEENQPLRYVSTKNGDKAQCEPMYIKTQKNRCMADKKIAMAGILGTVHILKYHHLSRNATIFM